MSMPIRPLAAALLGLTSGLAGATPPAAPAATALPPGCALVEVQNVRPQQGHLLAMAYASAEQYGREPVARARLPAGEATMRFQMCGLTGERVALVLLQDLDGDGKMGRNLLGLPTEPWGASGKPGLTGPNWEATNQPLDGQVLVVRLSS